MHLPTARKSSAMTKKREYPKILSQKSLIYKAFRLLEVTLQQTLQATAMSCLVAGHLSRRRAGRFASYGGNPSNTRLRPPSPF